LIGVVTVSTAKRRRRRLVLERNEVGFADDDLEVALRYSPARRTCARHLPLGRWENVAIRVHFACVQSCPYYAYYE